MGRAITSQPSEIPYHDDQRPVDAPAKPGSNPILYERSHGLEAFLKQINEATPMQMVEIERHGVASAFIVDLSERMELPTSRLYAMLRIPKATAARKTSAGEVIGGRAGQSVIGIVRLLAIAQDIVDDSTADEARDFDVVKWLGRWIEHPQPSLGGRRPSELIDTPTGVDIVARVLGAIRSGAYQ